MKNLSAPAELARYYERLGTTCPVTVTSTPTRQFGTQRKA